MYRCEAATVAGFVQQLACAYLRNGYHRYVVGEVPEGKDPLRVDERLIARYGIDVSKWVRARRRKAEMANLQYLRYRRFFVLLATKGEHEFIAAHRGQVRCIKETPISFGGYSIGYHRGFDGAWHVSVRIHPERYRDLKARLLELATRRTVEEIGREFGRLPFEPYAPVRRQLLALRRAVNRARRTAGMTEVPVEVLRLSRQVVRPFEDYGRTLKEAA